MRKIIVILLASVFFIVTVMVSMSVFAVSTSSNDQQVLQARYDTVAARVNYMSGVLGDTSSLVPQASDLTSRVSALNSDLNTLNGYVGSSDNSGFDSYVKGTITTDLKSSQDALKANVGQFKTWNITKATRDQLKTDIENRKAAFNSAVQQAAAELGNARLSQYNNDMSNANSQIANLSSKGIDTSAMQNIVSSAQTNVINPLQSAINSGDINATKEQLTSTCMYNGAPYSYHLAAKMDLARLNAITAKISANATAMGYGSQISDVNSKLSAAQSLLNQIGTNPYTGDQETQYYNTLQSASSEIKTIINNMKGGQNKQGYTVPNNH